MAKLTPRERRRERTRQEILASALTIINEEGPDELSLRELARRVDYSPAGLYEYFGSKEEIIEAVCHEGSRRLQNYLRSVPDTLPADEYLVELMLAYVRFARQNKDHFLLMFTRLTPDEEPIRYEEVEADETFQILLEAVQMSIDAGVIQQAEGLDAFEVAYSVWAVAHGLAMLQISALRNLQHDFSRADRVAAETYMRGLTQPA